jgi:rhodanese-related sulfurtransferase
MKKIVLAIIVIGMMLVSAGISVNAKKSEYNNLNSMSLGLNDCPINITVEEAYNMLTSTADGIQMPVDVRRADEWVTGFIDTPWPECPIWYIKDLFQNETGLQNFMDMYDGQDIILYCKGGYRSLIVAYILCDAGFTGTVYNMLGGITAWIAEGYPIRNNTQPDAPNIDGPTNVKVNQKIEYTFSATDHESDVVYYWIKWCDDDCHDEIEWDGPYASGEEVVFNNSWCHKGTHIIQAMARDFYGNESNVTEFEVTVPRSKSIEFKIIQLLFERYLHAFQIFKCLLGL